MRPGTLTFYQLSVERVVTYLLSHLDEAADLEALAGMAGLSPYHFHRIFRGMVGETPLELLRRLRLERAAFALRTTSTSVTTVAFDAGYETHESFTRAFRTHFGEAPSDFRRNRHARTTLAAASGIHHRPDGSISTFTPRDTGGHSMDVAIEHMPPLRLGTVSHRGPYNQIGKAFEKLGQIAGPSGLFGQPGAAMIATYHDDPDATPPDELRSEAGIIVPEGVPLPAALEEVHIPEGDYAKYTHIGGFEGLPDAWQRLMGEWVPASGRRLADSPSFEIYRSDMRTTPKEQLRTDIYVPLATGPA